MHDGGSGCHSPVARSSTMPDYEAVIGLEVHAQLRTRTKIFCGCPTTFGAEPNSQVCPVCLGHPGALPVLNRRAVELAVRGALALDCTIRPRSVFARKNYFYPDLPKGYQISQYDEPLAVGGHVPIEHDGGSRRIALRRLHLEEDAGKSIHDGFPDSDRFSYVDLNRSGVPLVEIVSAPEIGGPEEAYLFLQRLRSVLRYTEVCDGNMEQGSLRCDANVSIRPRGERTLGTRTELKNLNSFRNVQRALEHEITRQISIAEAGGEIEQLTVLWDAASGTTRPMRGKEEAHDYRYFPEPDLTPLVIDPAWVEDQRSRLPVLPDERRRRLVEAWSLAEHEAGLLSLERAIADYYEEVARLSGNPRAAANFILNDLQREQNAAGRREDEIPLAPAHLAELIRLVDAGTISHSVARQELFPAIYANGRSPAQLVRERGLEQLSAEAELEGLVRRVLLDHPDQLAQYRAGKEGLFGFFVGLVMRASGGRANPRVVGELLKRAIG
jgi:aspartyl-tRNA(Asn)/glutamyl-tRNA(Gln) amidotransferase subunit B